LASTVHFGKCEAEPCLDQVGARVLVELDSGAWVGARPLHMTSRMSAVSASSGTGMSSTLDFFLQLMDFGERATEENHRNRRRSDWTSLCMIEHIF
jgi:hypothetical protein